MTIRYGGELSAMLLPSITVEAPTGTSTTVPVEIGDLFKLGGTNVDGNGYKAAALVAGEDPGEVVMIQATERKTDVGPMSVRVLSGYRGVVLVRYEGTAPTLGQGIVTHATVLREVSGQAYADGKGYVLHVDTVAGEVEVLV